MNKALANIDSKKLLSIFGNAFFLAYFVLSFSLYRERLFGDTAYYLFNIVNYGQAFIAHNRIGAFMTQIPVLLALKTHVGLESLAKIFSVSFVLFYYMIFLILRYVYKRDMLAFLVVLLLSLGVKHLFYWPVDELSQALALALLYYAALTSYQKYEKLAWVGNLAVIGIAFALALINHPINSIVVLYVTGFDLFMKRRNSLLHLCLIVICIGFAIYQKFISPVYGAQRAFDISHVSFSYIYNVLILFITKYPVHLLFVALIIIYYLRKGKYLTMAFILMSLSGYLFFVISTQGSHTQVDWFYTEHLFLPLTVIVGLPLLCDALDGHINPMKPVFVVFLVVYVTVSLYTIASAGKGYRFRLQKTKEILSQIPISNHSKFVVNSKNYYDKDGMNREIHLSWSYPTETLVQTAIDGNLKTLVFDKALDQSIPDHKARYGRIVLAPWRSINYGQLNKTYFPLPKGDYFPLNTRMDFRRLTSWFTRNIAIDVPMAPKSVKRNSVFFLNVLLHNGNSTPLRSALVKGHIIHLSYHWLKGGKVVLWDGIRTPLEVDLYSTLTQKIKVLSLEAPGNYTLSVDLVAEGFRWFGINARVPLVVSN